MDCLNLKMGPIGCPKTLVTNYQSTMQNIPREQRSHLGAVQRQPEIMRRVNDIT